MKINKLPRVLNRIAIFNIISIAVLIIIRIWIAEHLIGQLVLANAVIFIAAMIIYKVAVNSRRMEAINILEAKLNINKELLEIYHKSKCSIIEDELAYNFNKENEVLRAAIKKLIL